MKYRPIGLAAAALSLALVVACGGSSSTPEGEDENTPPAGATAEATIAGPQEPASTGAATGSLTDGLKQDPVAIVNGEDIPLSELLLQLQQLEVSYQQQGVPLPREADLAQVRQQALNRLVQQRLVLQESEARGIVAEEAEVQAQYDETVASFPDEETFQETLAGEGLTEEDFRGLLEENIKVEKLLDSVIEEANLEPPTEDEVQQLYDQASHQQELPPLEEIRAQVEQQLVTEKENEVLQRFVEDLEAAGDIEILLNS